MSAGSAAFPVPEAIGQGAGSGVPRGGAAELWHPHQGGGREDGASGQPQKGEVEDQPQAQEVRGRECVFI